MPFGRPTGHPWWRHQMETFSALLAICAGNSPVPGEFPTQRPVTRRLIFTLICARINGWVNNREAGNLSRNGGHYDVIVMQSCMGKFAITVIASHGKGRGTPEFARNGFPKIAWCGLQIMALGVLLAFWRSDYQCPSHSTLPTHTGVPRPFWTKFVRAETHPYSTVRFLSCCTGHP